MPASFASSGTEPQKSANDSYQTEWLIGDEQFRALVEGLTQLVEGQRRFADEFGLNYERVFSDGFEAFKGRSVEDVLAEWLAADNDTADALTTLIQDLADHQLALVAAVETASHPQARGLRLPSPLKRHRGGQPDPMPPFVAAYARSRRTTQGSATNNEGS